MDPKDFFSHTKAFKAGGARGVAAGTGDNTEVTSAAIDRQSVGKNSFSALIVIAGSAVLAEGETLQIASNLQQSSDDGSADAYADVTAATFAAETVATGGAGGSTETFVYQKEVNLIELERYLKLQWTPNLSASGTDTFQIGAAVVLGGFVENPVQ